MSGESLECWKAEALRSREYIEKLESAITAARIADRKKIATGTRAPTKL
jgi:hypothetical protein